MSYDATLHVNGNAYPVQIEPGRSLLSVIRTELGLTGAKEGCDDSECGACMVLLDGRPVNSCSYLAAQADEREVTTVEGIGSGERLHPVQRELLAAGGVQCGFCTPGIVVSAKALLDRVPQPDADQVRVALAGNLCRCTGYQKIVEAVLRASGHTAPRT
jgi:aerobic-type carbon monoxide dehydrogenase small subunit (CoxS/CutS family)